MAPVLVPGQSLQYKPWQNTDMSDIIEKLPILQDGTQPWFAKLEEVLTGTQPALGHMKKQGVPGVEDHLERAGLHPHITTTVHDADLFPAYRCQLWRALRATFPTNTHPDNIVIEPLKEAKRYSKLRSALLPRHCRLSH